MTQDNNSKEHRDLEHRDLLDLDTDVDSIVVRTVLNTYKYDWGVIENVVTEDWNVIRRSRTNDGHYVY